MKSPRKAIIIASILIPLITAFSSQRSTISAEKKNSDTQIKTLRGPNVKILKTIHGCRRFKITRIHPNRYILSTSLINPFPPPIIYDIYEERLIKLQSLRGIAGLPVPPNIPYTKENRAEISRLKLAGQYWQWDSDELVYYNPEKKTAGILLVKSETVKTVQGNPPCSSCNQPTKLIEKYQRYYCYGCKKYVEEKEYLKEVQTYIYANMDLIAGRVTWMAPLGHEWMSGIGVDQGGNYFYFSDTINFYQREKTPDRFTLYRLNLTTRVVDWKYTIPISIRYKKSSASTYAINIFTSPDLSKIVFWEYDHEEYYDEGGKRVWRGYLSNPPAQAYVVDIPSRKHFSTAIPVTPYGHLIDRDNRYIVLGSNQKGTLHRINLASMREDLMIRSTKAIFKLILSASSRYLYVFTKNSVEVRSWPSLKMVTRLPISKVFPGIQKLLVSENVYSTQDGRFAAIGILKKGQSGPWAASDHDDGFHLLMIGD
jgi:hypothetical protein